MNLKCKICKSKNVANSFVVKEMYIGIRDEHKYFQCNSCGCLQILEIPRYIYKYYESDYYSYKFINLSSKFSRLAFRLRNEFALRGHGHIGRFLNAIKPTTDFDFLKPLLGRLHTNSRFLDVGCGAGVLLRSLNGLGFKNLKGIDPFIEKTINFADGCQIQKKDLASESGLFDVVMMHHSLEHMPDQLAALRDAYRLLADDGVCVIRIPLSSSYAFEHYRENWSQLDAPRHFYLHSVASLNFLANNCGFIVRDIRYDSTAFQFWGSEQYTRDIALHSPNSFARNKDKSIFSKRMIKEFKMRAMELNKECKGDQAIFYLYKL